MAYMDHITVRTSSQDIAICATVLRNCSSVLEGFLTDGFGPRVINMNEFDFCDVQFFLNFAKFVSHDQTECMTIETMITQIPRIMPIVHKYDANGIMNLAKFCTNNVRDEYILCQNRGQSAMSILIHDDGKTDWMSDDCKASLLDYISGDPMSKYPTTLGAEGKRTAKELMMEKLKMLPSKASQELLVSNMISYLHHLKL